MKNILVCDRDAIVLKTIEKKLLNDGYRVIAAKDGKIAKEAVKNMVINMIISGTNLQYASGMELIDYTRNVVKKVIPIIILTNEKSHEAAKSADEYLLKPLNLNQLSNKMRKLFKKF